jgi:superfamily I DNA/RNA helicase
MVILQFYTVPMRESRSMEDEKAIPYRIYGGLSFIRGKKLKMYLCYFLVINPKDEEALMRVINYPARGIGNTTIENYWLQLITTSVPSLR